MAAFLLPGIGVLAAILSACLAVPEERSAAIRCALAFGAGWLWYVSAWADWSPAMTLWRTTGVSVQPSAFWALGDALVGVYIFRQCGESWWCLALLATFMGQAACHALAALGLDSGAYLTVLNITFVTQVAVFVAVGGHGFVRKEIEDLA